MSIAYYPLPSIGIGRGPPRYAMYEPGIMSKEEYYEEEPYYGEEYEIYPEDKGEYIEGCENGECYRTTTSLDPEIMELSNAMQEGDLDENGVITADDVLQGPSGGWGGGVGNVLSPGLPQYLRNSLLPLDSWQKMETETEQEQDIALLEDELADTELKNKLDLEKLLGEKKAKISKWQMMMIAGGVTTLIAISVFIYKRATKRKSRSTATAAPSPPPAG